MTAINNKPQFANNFNFSTFVILTISIIFALLIGGGIYGYGTDYYAAYHKPNLLWGGIFDRLGYRVATLSINGVHIGVQMVTFFLALSSGLLIREHIKFKQSFSLIFFILLFLIAIHTWPIIMSTTNGMRQGLSMSFVFMALISSSRKNYFWMIVLSLVAIFMHKSGLLLVAIVSFSAVVNNLLAGFSPSSKTIINFLIGTLSFILAYLFFDIAGLNEENKPSKIIGGDFRGAFIFIGFVYVALSFFFKSILSNSFNLTLYYFSFIAPSLLMNGLNWEYERLGMMMLIPYILSFGVLLNRTSYQIYLILVFLLLLLLTIFTGMYASFK
tara:strand:+ start:1336 stop:2319 length:984 start_codon:yes stop_codon:yes gene_type:complete